MRKSTSRGSGWIVCDALTRVVICVRHTNGLHPMIVRGQKVRWVVSKTNLIGTYVPIRLSVHSWQERPGRGSKVASSTALGCGIGSTLHPGAKPAASSALGCARRPSFVVDQNFYLDLAALEGLPIDVMACMATMRTRNNLESCQLWKNTGASFTFVFATVYHPSESFPTSESTSKFSFGIYDG